MRQKVSREKKVAFMAARFPAKKTTPRRGVLLSGDFLPKQDRRGATRGGPSLCVSFECDSLSAEHVKEEKNLQEVGGNSKSLGSRHVGARRDLV